MKGAMIVVDANKQTCRAMCGLLEAHHYLGIPSYSVATIEELVEKSSCPLVIFDLDSVTVDNRYFRDLKRRCPGLFIIAVSGRPIHPELKESLGNYIFACLGKPIDPDELIYLLRSIFCDGTASEDCPAHVDVNAARERRHSNHQTGGHEERQQ